MALDFDDLVQPIHGTKFSTLRPAQVEVLRIYVKEAYSKTDLAVELPTGAGKTLLALLILDYWRRAEGKKVAILTGNKALAKQVEQEAAHLHLNTVRFEGSGASFPASDLRLYRRGQAIAIMNYWVYINQNPSVDIADYLVLDDAQLAVGALQSLYSIQIDRNKCESLFKDLMNLLSQHTDSPVAEDVLKDLDDPFTTPADMICFPDFLRMKDEAEALVSQYLSSHSGPDVDDLKFRWERNRARLAQGLWLVSSHEIVFRPYIYPFQEYSHLSEPQQRVYMSATIHEPQDLSRRLGSPPIVKLDVPKELIKEEDGRGLFIFNQVATASPKKDVPEEVLEPLRQLLLDCGKSVWLCSSGHEADKWRSWLQSYYSENELSVPPTWLLTSTGDELESFRVSATGHLFIAGRFEGMDFPDDVCRLAVFPSLPRATGLLERFFADHLRDASFLRMRTLERIKQGIGRCIRGRKDYAVCYFIDPRFYSEMESAEFGELVSEQIRREVEVGLQLTEAGMGQVTSVALKFLKGHFSDFDRRAAKAQPPAVKSRPKKLLTASSVGHEINGWKALYSSRDFETASSQFQEVLERIQDDEREHRAFWRYNQAFAEYLRHSQDQSPGAIQNTIRLLKEATREGGLSSWFNRLTRATNRLAKEQPTELRYDLSRIFDNWDLFVEQYPYRRGRFMKWQAALKASMDGTHDQVSEALEVLGTLLGFSASRSQAQGAPDNLWRSTDYALTIELKIELDRDSVSLRDITQATGQTQAAKTDLGLNDERVDGIIVTQLSKIDEAADKARGSIRILSLPVVDDLRNRLEAIMREYWQVWDRGDAAARATARETAARRLPPPGWLNRAIRSSKGPFISAPELFREWKA